jgi:3-oxoadipate enol-lactonase
MTVPTIRATRSGTAGAPLLVLGPSLGTSTVVWEDAARVLGAEFDILSWDLPGHGISPSTREPFTIAELADAVLGLAEDRRFHYAGVSLGGAVGLELALRHPQRVDRLSMICSLARFGEATSWEERAALVRAQSTSVLVGASAGRWFSPGSIARLPETTGRLLNALAATDDESYALCCEALAAYDLRGELTDLRAPLLAISGHDDPVAPPDVMADLAAATPHGHAVDVADAGHLASAEQPDVVASLLIDFFRKDG